jgi:hypothetical protein
MYTLLSIAIALAFGAQQPQTIRALEDLAGKQVVAREARLCRPDTNIEMPSYAGKTGRVISVKSANRTRLSEDYLNGLSPQARAMMVDQQKAATIIVQFDDGVELDTCGPVTRMTVSEHFDINPGGESSAGAVSSEDPLSGSKLAPSTERALDQDPAQADAPRTASTHQGSASSRPRVFLQAASHGNNWNAVRDQSMEMAKDFEKLCPGVLVTINSQNADYTVILSHIELGWIIRDNQMEVADRNGDLLRMKEGGGIKGGVKNVCSLILSDWASQ